MLQLPIQELPRTNWTEHTHYRDYFDATTRKLAEELYAEDLRQLDYEF